MLKWLSKTLFLYCYLVSEFVVLSNYNKMGEMGSGEWMNEVEYPISFHKSSSQKELDCERMIDKRPLVTHALTTYRVKEYVSY